jgi:hypothetical protein
MTPSAQSIQQMPQIVTVQRQEGISPSGQRIITTVTHPYSDNKLQFPQANPLLNKGSVQELKRFR